MPERYMLYGKPQPDGTVAFTPKDVYNMNKNFDVIGLKLWGNINFAESTEERVEYVEKSIKNVTQELTPEGFVLRDSNGKILISTNGVANSDNFSDTMNCENGFPLTLSFFIDDDVSTLTKASIRYNNRPFRADSKTIASGGGTKTSSTKASQSVTSASGNLNESFTGAEIGILASGSSPVYGTHVTNGGHLVQEHIHKHNIEHAHTVTVPSHFHETDTTHVHGIDYGIVEKPITDQTNQIYIDNVLVGTTTDARGIFNIDLVAHPIGAGWHDLEVRTTTLKRISATMNIKSYIRR